MLSFIKYIQLQEQNVYKGSIIWISNKQTKYYENDTILFYRRESVLPIEEIEENNEETINTKESILQRKFNLLELGERRNEALENIEKSQRKQKKRFDKKIKETVFQIGEKVLLKESFKEKQWTGKLSQNWKGPYYIHEVYGKGAYKIKTMDGKILKVTQNVKNLKRYYDRRNILPSIYV